MLPGQADLNLYRGDTARYRFVLWQDAAKSMAVDLTGVAAAAQIRDRADSGRVVLDLGCSVSLPNTVEVVVEAASAALLPAAKGAWDLQLTWPGGDVQTVVAGSVYVMADVTRVAVDA